MLVVSTPYMYFWFTADPCRGRLSKVQPCSLCLRNFVGMSDIPSTCTDRLPQGMHICLETLPHRSFLQSNSDASRHHLQHVRAPPVHPSHPRLFQAQIQVWIILRLIPLILWSVIVPITTLVNRSLLFKKEPQVGEEPLRALEDRGLHDPFPLPGI